MTSAPFRDLFVELPRAVFDALQAWGEAVIVKAQQPAPAPRPRTPTALDRTTLLAWRYGWREAESWRNPWDCTTEIVALLQCGHRQRYTIEDRAFLAEPGPAWQLHVIDRVVDNTPRDCYCVLRCQQ